MIRKLRIVESESLNPYENMGLEEYLLHDVKDDECILYLWQNRNTVVIGRNQNAWKECKVDDIIKDKGYLSRRLSGGGAVYHDLGNLNFTFLAQQMNYNVERQLDVIYRAVKALGIEAVKTGRNDLTIDGRKFSGNAFYKIGGHCYHHGTLMLNVDTENLSKYLAAPSGKLVSKGVESVKSRVINISEAYGDVVDVQTMKNCLIQAFTEVYPEHEECEHIKSNVEYRYSPTDFSSWDWIYGRNIVFDHELTLTTDKGRIGARVSVDGGYIKDIVVDTDFMEPIDTTSMEQELVGRKYSENEVREVLQLAGN